MPDAQRPDRTLGPLDTESWPVPFKLRKFEGSAVGGDGIVVVFNPRARGVTLGGRYWTPAVMEALIDRPGLPLIQMRVEMSPTGPVCSKLTLAATAPHPLTSSQIRVRLDELVREVATLVGGLDPETMEDRSDEYGRVLDRLGPSEPGKRLPDELFQEVADVYRYALRLGQAPTDAVAEALNVSRSTAGRYVVRARRRGFLGPAIPGRPGEQEPEGKDPTNG